MKSHVFRDAKLGALRTLDRVVVSHGPSLRGAMAAFAENSRQAHRERLRDLELKYAFNRLFGKFGGRSGALGAPDASDAPDEFSDTDSTILELRTTLTDLHGAREKNKAKMVTRAKLYAEEVEYRWPRR